MTVIGTDTFPIPRFLTEGDGIDLQQDGVSQALKISLSRASELGAIPDPLYLFAGGQSNSKANQLADTGDKTGHENVLAWVYNYVDGGANDTGSWVTATLGSAPFRAAEAPYSAPNNHAFQVGVYAARTYGVQVRIIHYAESDTVIQKWIPVAVGGDSGLTNNYDKTQTTGGGVKPKVQAIIEAAMRSELAVRENKTTLDMVLWAQGESNSGDTDFPDLLRVLLDTYYSEPWFNPDSTRFLQLETSQRTDYGDIDQAMRYIYGNALYKNYALIPTAELPNTIDDYPNDGDYAHFSGEGFVQLGVRTWRVWESMPVGYIANAGGSGNGTVNVIFNDPVTTISDPYEMNVSNGSAIGVFTGNAQTVYINLDPTQATRNTDVLIHNFSQTGLGYITCDVAGSKLITITDIDFVDPAVFTYTGTAPFEDTSRLVFQLTGVPQIDDKEYIVSSLDRVAKTFSIKANAGGAELSGTGWTSGSFVPTGTAEVAKITFRDPRTGIDGADHIYLFPGETVRFRKYGASVYGPFRTELAYTRPEYAYNYDAYDPRNQVGNGDFHAMDAGWKLNQWSGDSTVAGWLVGDVGTGWLAVSRSIYHTGYTDRQGDGNSADALEAYPLKAITCAEGDTVLFRWMTKTSAAPTIGTYRAFLRFYDSTDTLLREDTGTSDTAERATWIERKMFSTGAAPADTAYCVPAIRLNKTAGTVWIAQVYAERMDDAHGDYGTRAELVTDVACGFLRSDGLVTFADGVAYKWQSGATDIPDLPGLVPAGDATPEHFGAVGDGTTNAAAAFNAGLVAGYILHGDPLLTYGVTGQVTFATDGGGLVDVALKQLAPDASQSVVTLYSLDKNNLFLLDVSVDKNGDGTNAGGNDAGVNAALNTCFGIDIDGGTGHHLENLSVTGNDSGSGIRFKNLDHTSVVIRPRAHDMFAVQTAPSDDILQGIVFSSNVGLSIYDPVAENLYHRTSVGGANERRYTRGMIFVNNQRCSIYSPTARFVDQGIDCTTSSLPGNIANNFYAPNLYDCATWGFKLAGTHRQNRIYGGRAVLCAYAAVSHGCGYDAIGVAEDEFGELLTVSQADANIFYDFQALNCGTAAGARGGFATGPSTLTQTVPAGFVRCTAIDNRSPAEMPYGFINTATPSSVYSWCEDCIAIGATTALYRGMVFQDRLTHIARLSSGRTLTSTTADQAIFGTDRDALTVEDDTIWEFELELYLSGLSSSSGNFSFSLGGTATFGGRYESRAAKIASTTPSAVHTPEFTTSDTLSARTLVTANANTAGYALIKGHIIVTGPGTVIPQVALSVATAATVGATTIFKARKIMTAVSDSSANVIAGAIG